MQSYLSFGNYNQIDQRKAIWDVKRMNFLSCIFQICVKMTKRTQNGAPNNQEN
jgi:hypothetical protein